MEVIDLTLPINVDNLEQDAPAASFRSRRNLSTHTWTLSGAPADTTPLPAASTPGEPQRIPGGCAQRPLGAPAYHARVHDFTHWSMAGTYLDLPGHIIETDDGMDAARLPLERLFRLSATVVHLDRASGSGRISAGELAAAAPSCTSSQALIIHALGPRRFDEIDMRSVYLGRDAVQWIIDTGIGLLVADVYESDAHPQGVFPLLFSQGILTVCYPVNLQRLRTPRSTLTVLPLRFRAATQLPCRVVVEQEDDPWIRN